MKKKIMKIFACSQIIIFLLPLSSVYGKEENNVTPKKGDVIETNPINLVNGNFEEPIISDNSYVQFTEDKVPGWRTTASDKLIEIQSNGLDNITAYSGRQWAELIAAEPSALYQDVETKPGSYVYWEVAHKARLDHTDIAAVKFGAPNGTLETQAIMSTGNENWKVYSGYYKVPKGQNITRFQFESLLGSTNLIGNLIDNVKFTSEYYGSNIIVDYKDIEGNKLVDTETFKGPIGKEYDISHKDIPFYSLVKIEGNPKGTYTEEDQRVTFIYQKIKGKPVTIRYEDEQGNKLAESEVLIGNLGDRYETKAKEIKGWKVKQSPENAQGVYSDQAQEVVYIYERAEGKGVTVRYEDEQGNKLAESEVLIGNLGDRYETKAKEIKGWKVKQSPENAQGVYSDQAQEVVYIYERAEGKGVTVRYEDEQGNKLAESEVLIGNLGDRYETKAKEIKGWKVKQSPENAQGVYSDQAQEVVYIYERAEGKGVTVRYEDEQGNKLAESEVLIGNLGDRYETKAKEIKGWKVKQSPENAQGVYSDQAQEVVYIYERAEGKGVTVRYEDEQGNKLAESEVLIGNLGDRYETKAKEIKGWKVKQSPENAQGVYSDQAQEVVYVYERAEGKGVTVRYEDEQGNKLADSETLKGKYGIRSKKTTDAAENREKKYPQTGEDITNGFFEIGMFLVMISGAILFFKSKKDI